MPGYVSHKGRADFYDEYKVQVCSVVRETSFRAKGREPAGA